GGRRRDREGRADPHQQRDAARPEVRRSHARARIPRGWPPQARRREVRGGDRLMPVAEPKINPRLKQRYFEEIRPSLVDRFRYSSVMEAPRLQKITLNMGVGEAKTDTKLLDNAQEQLATIAGQKPNVRVARKSIAAFKIRDGMPIGVAVTLRGARMWEFLD